MTGSVHSPEPTKCGDAFFRGCITHASNVECVLEVERQAIALPSRAMCPFSRVKTSISICMACDRWRKGFGF